MKETIEGIRLLLRLVVWAALAYLMVNAVWHSREGDYGRLITINMYEGVHRDGYR